MVLVNAVMGERSLALSGGSSCHLSNLKNVNHNVFCYVASLISLATYVTKIHVPCQFYKKCQFHRFGANLEPKGRFT